MNNDPTQEPDDNEKETSSYPWASVFSLVHSEMLLKAQQIHPNATVRVNDETDTWEIVLSTDIRESYEVDPAWAGTPAEAAILDAEYPLSSWAESVGMYSSPLYKVVEAYNIWAEKMLQLRAEQSLLYKHFELKPMNELTPKDIDSLDSSTRKLYIQIHDGEISLSDIR